MAYASEERETVGAVWSVSFGDLDTILNEASAATKEEDKKQDEKGEARTLVEKVEDDVVDQGELMGGQIEVTVSSLDGEDKLRTFAPPSWTALDMKLALAKSSEEYTANTNTVLLLGGIPVDDGQTLQSLGFALGDKAVFTVALPNPELPVGRYAYHDHSTSEYTGNYHACVLTIAPDGSATYYIKVGWDNEHSHGEREYTYAGQASMGAKGEPSSKMSFEEYQFEEYLKDEKQYGSSIMTLVGTDNKSKDDVGTELSYETTYLYFKIGEDGRIANLEICYKHGGGEYWKESYWMTPTSQNPSLP